MMHHFFFARRDGIEVWAWLWFMHLKFHIIPVQYLMMFVISSVFVAKYYVAINGCIISLP